METRLSNLKNIYRELYQVMKVQSDKTAQLNNVCDRIIENKTIYDEIEEQTEIPWWFVGAIHYMECNLMTDRHFYNGDPLTARTVNVPKGKPIFEPKNGDRYTFAESAISALQDKNFDDVKDNSVEAWLWRAHLYNGFGAAPYLGRGGKSSYLYTPYLWSGTSIYQKGKFVADGEYNPDAVSQQIGVAPLIKKLIDYENQEKDISVKGIGDEIAPFVLKCVCTTYVKCKPEQSTHLNKTEKCLIDADEILEAFELKGLNEGHYKIKLKNPKLSSTFEYQEVYLFAPHWGLIKGEIPEIEAETPKPEENISAAVGRQIERLRSYMKSSSKPDIANTGVTYYSQRDNPQQWWRTCNTSSNAMYLDWLRRVTERQSLGGDNDYLATVFKHGDSTWHSVQTDSIKDYGFSTKWMTDADIKFVRDLLDYGFPVVCNILHKGNVSKPYGGHIIVLIGRNGGYMKAHDPWGTLNSYYKITNGAYSKIKESEFIARWQGGYRILA